MNAFGELWRAIIGWLDLLTARDEAAGRFNLTAPGLVNATGFYVVVVLLLIAVQSWLSGFPGWTTILLALLVNIAQLAAVWAAIAINARITRAPIVALAVPATYAMAFVLAVSLPLAYAAGPNVLTAMLGVIGYMLFRVGRAFGGLGRGISAAFAILAVAALVAVQVGLYMLTT